MISSPPPPPSSPSSSSSNSPTPSGSGSGGGSGIAAGTKRLISNEEAIEKMVAVLPYLPSAQFAFIGTSIGLFFGGAVYGAKSFLKSEDISTNLTKSLQSKPVSRIAWKALGYGTALAVTSFSAAVLFYCTVTGTSSAQQFGRNMKTILRFTEYPGGYTEEKEKRLRQQQEREMQQQIDGLIETEGKSVSATPASRSTEPSA